MKTYHVKSKLLRDPWGFDFNYKRVRGKHELIFLTRRNYEIHVNFSSFCNYSLLPKHHERCSLSEKLIFLSNTLNFVPCAIMKHFPFIFKIITRKIL